MRHYEIVFLVHANQAQQVTDITTRYHDMIAQQGGKIHRLEDWGMRSLAYPIEKSYKACYVLMNVFCSPETIAEIRGSFRFSDAILRHLIIRLDEAIEEISPIQKRLLRNAKQKAQREQEEAEQLLRQKAKTVAETPAPAEPMPVVAETPAPAEAAPVVAETAAPAEQPVSVADSAAVAADDLAASDDNKEKE